MKISSRKAPVEEDGFFLGHFVFFSSRKLFKNDSRIVSFEWESGVGDFIIQKFENRLRTLSTNSKLKLKIGRLPCTLPPPPHFPYTDIFQYDDKGSEQIPKVSKQMRKNK